MAWSQSRWAGVEDGVEDPFRCHHSVGVLSMQSRMVQYHTTKHWEEHSWWRMPPARLRSELVTDPLGFLKETRFATTLSGKCALHMMGCAAVGSFDCMAALGCCYGTCGMKVVHGIHVPPHMYPEA